MSGNGDDAPFPDIQVAHVPHVGRAVAGIGDGHAAADDAGDRHADRHDVGDDHAAGDVGPGIGEGDGVGDGVARIGGGRDDGFGDDQVGDNDRHARVAAVIAKGAKNCKIVQNENIINKTKVKVLKHFSLRSIFKLIS